MFHSEYILFKLFNKDEKRGISLIQRFQLRNYFGLIEVYTALSPDNYQYNKTNIPRQRQMKDFKSTLIVPPSQFCCEEGGRML